MHQGILCWPQVHHHPRPEQQQQQHDIHLCCQSQLDWFCISHAAVERQAATSNLLARSYVVVVGSFQLAALGGQLVLSECVAPHIGVRHWLVSVFHSCTGWCVLLLCVCTCTGSLPDSTIVLGSHLLLLLRACIYNIYFPLRLGYCITSPAWHVAAGTSDWRGGTAAGWCCFAGLQCLFELPLSW